MADVEVALGTAQILRLVFAKDGKLFTGKAQDNRLVATELADFNGRKPERIIAPDWAQPCVRLQITG